ncbi:MAG: protease inhibitor I42 family protein [Coriobacteriia bacterium]|nr:protease inhibitor I42 family protein [Actinomycetota bacterium]MDZ4167023.1 protease inhibitor I42 family protein [Coriobacteriia bacterium]
MVRRTLVTVVMLVVLVAATGCSESRAMFGQQDDGESVRVGVGQVLEVALPSNPTTGYSWQVVEVPGFLTQAGEPAFEPREGDDVVGAGGTEILRFEVTGAGSGVLLLEYRRPWEADVPADETFILDITAR